MIKLLIILMLMGCGYVEDAVVEVGIENIH